MDKRKILGLVFSAFFVAFTLIAGCAPAQKPTPSPAPPPAKKDVMPTRTVDNTKATKIARACDAVPGVRKSTVVISGNTAYVGLDLAANLEKGETNSVEKACLNKAKAADPSIKTVYVASDVDTVTRLKKVYQGIADGKPVSSFARELSEIGRRLTPKTER